MKTDVLIVGAGPVGLNLALCLSHLGISYRIIDKKSGLNTTSNAIGVNPRTLEVWQTLGIADEAIKRGLKLQAASWYDNGKFLNAADFALSKSEYKFMLALPQAHTEQLLNEQLAKFSAAVEWNTELISFTDDSKVIAICKHQDNTEQIEANWIVGCDGYRSSVRDLSGISRVCHDLTQHFIMVDAQLNGEISHAEMSVGFHDDGILFFFPMKGSMRIVAEISGDSTHSGVKIGDKAIFDDILSKRFPGLSIKEIEWASAFYVHECLAERYLKNHVILCGDAAHTHSPAGGQGMNTGIQDTWNLAWKLAHVLRGEASSELLESYHNERHQIGAEVLERSGRITKVGTTSNKVLQAVRNFGISHIVGLDMVASKFVNSIAQTDIYYNQSSLIDAKQVLALEKSRHQMSEISWLLLSSEPLGTQELPSFIHVKQSDEHHLVLFTMCLIRPDGYIALYANTVAEVIQFLQQNKFLI